MLVSELVTLLQQQNQSDDVVVLIDSKQYNPSLQEYQGVVAVCVNENDDFAREYEIRRHRIERDEIKLQKRLDDVKDKKNKLKPKP